MMHPQNVSCICLPKRFMTDQVKYYEIHFIQCVQTLCLFVLKIVCVQQSWILDKRSASRILPVSQ